jgi:hypothetical protein
VRALVASLEPRVEAHTRARTLAPPLVMFFVVAYALSWAWWLPIVVSGGLPGLLGPLIAAIVVLAVTEGRTGVRRWITTMVLWPRERRWQLAAVAPLAFLGLGLAAVAVTGDVPPMAESIQYSGTAASVGALGVAVVANAFRRGGGGARVRTAAAAIPVRPDAGDAASRGALGGLARAALLHPRQL